MRKLEAWGDLVNKHLREERARARPCRGNRRKGRLAGGEARGGVCLSSTGSSVIRRVEMTEEGRKDRYREVSKCSLCRRMNKTSY